MIGFILCVTLFRQSINYNIITMNQNNNSSNAKDSEPVLDFISGKTQTSASKRITRSIVSLQSLWQLAKMSRIVRESSKD